MKFNVTINNDPYLLPYIDEVINIVVGHEVYTFIDGFFGHHHISIGLKDQYKIAFINDWVAFVWVVMPFGIKKWTTHLLEGSHKSFP